MQPFDFRPFEKMYPEWEMQFRAGPGPGAFSWKKGGPTSLYGSTDMVFNRRILGTLDPSETEKDSWAAEINRFQNPRSGWYRKRYTLHFRSHTAAYAAAALHLLNRRPAYPIRKAGKVGRSPETLKRWMRRIPWSIIWPASHEVAGMPAIPILTGDIGRDVPAADENPAARRFLESWKAWLDEEVHPETGFWSRGILQRLGLRPALSRQEMGGAFHMYYIYEAMGWPWALPEKVVDAALTLQGSNGFWDKDVSYCIDLDGLYCLTRSSRNAGDYRADDVKQACILYLSQAEATLNDRDFLFTRYDNSHRLPGALAAVAECALFYPELVRTERPWTQTLDLACYI